MITSTGIDSSIPSSRSPAAGPATARNVAPMLARSIPVHKKERITPATPKAKEKDM